MGLIGFLPPDPPLILCGLIDTALPLFQYRISQSPFIFLPLPLISAGTSDTHEVRSSLSLSALFPVPVVVSAADDTTGDSKLSFSTQFPNIRFRISLSYLDPQQIGNGP